MRTKALLSAVAAISVSISQCFSLLFIKYFLGFYKILSELKVLLNAVTAISQIAAPSSQFTSAFSSPSSLSGGKWLESESDLESGLDSESESESGKKRSCLLGGSERCHLLWPFGGQTTGKFNAFGSFAKEGGSLISCVGLAE